MAVTDHSQNADLDATDYHNHITNTFKMLEVKFHHSFMCLVLAIHSKPEAARFCRPFQSCYEACI